MVHEIQKGKVYFFFFLETYFFLQLVTAAYCPPHFQPSKEVELHVCYILSVTYLNSS